MRKVQTLFLEPCFDRTDKYVHPTHPEVSIRLAEAIVLLGDEGWRYGGSLPASRSDLKRHFFQREIPDVSPYR